MKTAITYLIIFLSYSVENFPLRQRTDEEDPDNDKRKKSNISNKSNHHDLSTLGEILKVNHFQDDVYYDYPPHQLRFHDAKIRKRRVAMFKKLWPKSNDGMVYVPYLVAGGVPYEVEALFKTGVEYFNNRTCIRFIPRKKDEKDYVLLVNDALGCWAQLGFRNIGVQKISLYENGCLKTGIALHEMMHVISIAHTMERMDRDKYVKVFQGNIETDALNQFSKHSPGEYVVSGLPFDLNSVMMYGKYDFAVNDSLPVMISVKSPEEEFTRADMWTDGDVLEINRLYQCDD